MAKDAHPLTSSPAAQERLAAAIAANSPGEPAKPAEPAAEVVQNDTQPPKPPEAKVESKDEPKEPEKKPGDLARALEEKHREARRSKALQLENEGLKAKVAEYEKKAQTPQAPDPAKFINREEARSAPARFVMDLGMDAKTGMQFAEDLYYLFAGKDAPADKLAVAQARAGSYRAEDNEKQLLAKVEQTTQAMERKLAEAQRQQAIVAHQGYVLAQLPKVSEETHPLTKAWAEDKPAELARFLTDMQVAYFEKHGGQDPLPFEDLIDGFEEQLGQDPLAARLKKAPKAKAAAAPAQKDHQSAGISDQAGSTGAKKPLKELTAKERLALAIEVGERERARAQAK